MALRTGHRKDIQGLRAVLMFQVLGYHAWNIGSPIGIDAFILISAYLMTSSFIRRSEAGAIPVVWKRWAATFKRLMPPLLVTVLATLGLSFLLLPMSRWHEMSVQSIASITYWENWRLAAVSADYYAQDHALASPLQHLWSMSMQGQMFLLWPVVMALSALAARALRLPIRRLVFLAFLTLTVASLAWLLTYGPVDGSVYFDTRARIWEFAFGSTVAAAAPWIKIRKNLAVAATSIGLVVILLFSTVKIGTYPGPMAFFPMIAASSIMLFGPAASGHYVDRFLSLRPLVFLGNISYGVYLTHWPLFVFFLVTVGKPSLSLAQGVSLIAVSFLLGWLMTKLVETPVKKSQWINRSPSHQGAVVLLCLLIGLVPAFTALSWVGTLEARELRSLEPRETSPSSSLLAVETKDPHPGARVIFEDLDPNFTEDPIPSPLVAANMWVKLPGACREWPSQNIEVGDSGQCHSLGDPESATAKVLIAGNSHAQQNIVSVVEPLAVQEGWSVDSIYRRCLWTASEYLTGDCAEIMQQVTDYVGVLEPDYVFLQVTQSSTKEKGETLVPGIEVLIEELIDSGATVFGVRDTPRGDEDLLECVGEQLPTEAFGGCFFDKSLSLAGDSILDPLRGIEGLHLIDMTDAFCVDGHCPTIIGNVRVYMDTNHVGPTYSETLAPYFAQRVLRALAEEEVVP